MRITIAICWVATLVVSRSVHSATRNIGDSSTSLRASDVLTIRAQMADWWGYWYQQNDSAAARLQSEFDRDWAKQADARRLPLSGEDAAEFNRKHDTSKAVFLCSWKQEHITQPNPKPLSVCNPETTIAAQVTAQVVQQREADRRQRDEQRRAAANRAAIAQQGKRRAAAARERSVTVPAIPPQQAYVANCNNFAWRGDKVQCEVGIDRTLRIYQHMQPPGGDLEADTVKYLINHRDKLKAIKEVGFDKMEAVVIGGNGPGRNSSTTMSLGDDGTFNVLKICYDGTDNRRHCDPAN
jgi:hypothetical protein